MFSRIGVSNDRPSPCPRECGDPSPIPHPHVIPPSRYPRVEILPPCRQGAGAHPLPLPVSSRMRGPIPLSPPTCHSPLPLSSRRDPTLVKTGAGIHHPPDTSPLPPNLLPCYSSSMKNFLPPLPCPRGCGDPSHDIVCPTFLKRVPRLKRLLSGTDSISKSNPLHA